MAAASHALRGVRKERRRERLLSFGTMTTFIVGSMLLGLMLAFVATLFESSVAVYIAVPLFPLLAIAVLAAPIVAPLGVFATFPVGSTGAPIGAATLQSVEAAVVIVALMIIIRRLAMGQTPLAWSPVLYWPVALIVWMLISLFSAVDETLAVKQLISTMGGLTFACRNPLFLQGHARSPCAARRLRPRRNRALHNRPVERRRIRDGESGSAGARGPPPGRLRPPEPAGSPRRR